LSQNYVERPRFSCALGGALETITSLPGVAPVIHAASGCGGNLFGAQQAGGLYGAGYCGGLSMPSSNVAENEIIFGGVERLTEQIESTLELVDARLLFIVTGCMTDIIGDDLRAAINPCLGRGTDILALHTGGFRGNSYKGYDLTLQTLFTEYTVKTVRTQADLVNVWGLAPAHDPFFRGDLENVKHLLALLGLRANTFFTYDETLSNLKNAGAARLNIVLSPVNGLGAAAAFQEKHGVPAIVVDLPIGAGAAERFLYTIAAALGLEKKIAAKAVGAEKDRYYRYIERVSDSYTDMDLQQYFLTVANSTYAAPLTRCLAEDFGWLPELTVVTDLLDEDEQEKVRAGFRDFRFTPAPRLVFETDASQIQRHFTGAQRPYRQERYYDAPAPLFVLGSSQEAELATRLGAKYLSVSYPLNDRAVLSCGYAGFRGGLRLFEDLLYALIGR
jgi:nitrogenase molybdenum-iron protein beta chain